jgi:hypothetical protein
MRGLGKNPGNSSARTFQFFLKQTFQSTHTPTRFLDRIILSTNNKIFVEMDSHRLARQLWTSETQLSDLLPIHTSFIPRVAYICLLVVVDIPMHSNRDYHRPKSSGGGYSSRGNGGGYGQGGSDRGYGGNRNRGGDYRQSNERNTQQNDHRASNNGRGGSLPTGRNGASNFKPKHQGLSPNTFNPECHSLLGNQMERPNQVMVPEAVSVVIFLPPLFSSFNRLQW